MANNPSLRAQIQSDLQAAMKAQDKERLSAIRLIMAAIKQVELNQDVQSRAPLSDEAVYALLEKMKKQRVDAIAAFEQAQRLDLVAKEQQELQVIAAYMPEPLDPETIRMHAQDAIRAVGATGIRDMGKVIAALRPHVQGRADMAMVTGIVKALLQTGEAPEA